MAKTMISIPDEFLALIDEIAAAEQRSRSELIREALREYIRKGHGPVRPIEKPEVRKALKGLRTLKWTDRFDSTAAVRQMRDRRHP
jgi:Arc/MetJ-type ribon-helix-helix transcriptional regulator